VPFYCEAEMSSRHKRSSSSLLRAVLAAAVLYFALDLSAGSRGILDYVIIGFVACAIAYNVFELGRRLFEDEGGRGVWHVVRTVLFWTIGLGNTAWVRPEDVGTWRNWLGWLMLFLAAFDTFLLQRKEKALLQRSSRAESEA